MREVVSPYIERVALTVPEHLRERLEAFAREKGWTVEDGVKILLAYAADVASGHQFTPEETYNEWAAARAELAVLRHRAYSATEASRTMKLNLAGLEAKNAQFRRSLQTQYARRDRLRKAVAEQEQRLAHPMEPSRDNQTEPTAAESG